ncbi:MAG: hypothetical protein OWT28_04445, partial [Firmicutes bacterium]|nr:hypothetical protein [Bacillota bacterium]
MITRYYEILLDVFIGLAFAVGFKVIGGYAMKMMHGWFKDEPAFQEGSVPPATVDKSRKKRAISFLSLGLAAVWLLSGLIQIRPVLVTTRASAIVTVLLGAPFAQHPDALAQTLARIWSTHAITGNILSIVCQVSLFLLIALGGSHWLGRLSVWLSALLSLALFVLLFGASGFIAGLSDLILGSNGTPFWLFVLCVLLMLPAHVWSSPKALHAVQVGRT